MTRNGLLLKMLAGDLMKKQWLILAAVLMFLPALSADDFAQLKFVVLRDYNGKPIRNASVVMHPVEKDGRQSRGGLELKADAEGRASFDGVPYGKLRVQVLAPGFQTFGQDYDIDEPVEEITVRMKRPQKQYSIYEDHPEQKKDDAAGGEKKEEAKPAEPDSKDKPQ